jgi:hypothetical protein
MDSKFYVSLEAARLLKEKGYNEETDYIIDEDNCMMNSRYVLNKDLAGYVYSCPSKAEAIDWLESKGIVIELSYDDQGHMDNARWQYFIYTNDEDGWVEGVVCSWMEGNYFKTRLEAEEAVIVKALELL